jgi:Zn-dependent protease
VDEVKVVLGMPLLVYHDIEDQMVSPGQHIIRAVGGPLANIILLAAASFIKRFIKTETIGIEIVDAARNTNLVLLIAGLTPQPWLDGGAILKWTLVSKGSSLKGADKAVRQANYAAAAGLSGAAVVAFKKSKKAWGGLFAGLAVLSLGAAVGLFREKA